jgi:hypothetical protein
MKQMRKWKTRADIMIMKYSLPFVKHDDPEKDQRWTRVGVWNTSPANDEDGDVVLLHENTEPAATSLSPPNGQPSLRFGHKLTFVCLICSILWQQVNSSLNFWTRETA